MFACFAFCLIHFTNAGGETVSARNASFVNLLIWNDQVLAISHEERFLSRSYCLYSVSPDSFHRLETRTMSFREYEHFQASGNLLMKRHGYTNAPFSFFIYAIEYSICESLQDNNSHHMVFTPLPVEQNEIAVLSDGKLFKIQDKKRLFCYDSYTANWKEILLPCELLVNNRNYCDHCICISFEESVYYSPHENRFYTFSSLKNNQLINYALNNSSLIYSDIGGIYECTDESSEPILLFKAGDGTKEDKNIDFIIDNDVLYLYDHHSFELYRWSLIESAYLPKISIHLNKELYLVKDGFVYTIYTAENNQSMLRIIELDTLAQKEICLSMK